MLVGLIMKPRRKITLQEVTFLVSRGDSGLLLLVYANSTMYLLLVVVGLLVLEKEVNYRVSGMVQKHFRLNRIQTMRCWLFLCSRRLSPFIRTTQLYHLIKNLETEVPDTNWRNGGKKYITSL